MLEKIQVDGKLAALIIRRGTGVKSSTFFSPSNLYFQLAIFMRPKDFEEGPHYHKRLVRKVTRVEQFLYLLDGAMQVNFYNRKRKLKKTKRVGKGDGILLIQGVHSLKITKDTKAISVKQGPFLGDNEDKVNVRIKK